MKSVSRLLVTGAGVAAAFALAAAPASAAVASAPAPVSVNAAQACTWQVTTTTIKFGCAVSLPLVGSVNGSFSGTFHGNGTASGTVVFTGGILGSINGTWNGGPFVSGKNATINYSASTPIGPVSGSIVVDVP